MTPEAQSRINRFARAAWRLGWFVFWCLIVFALFGCGTSTRDGVSGPEITAPPAADVGAEESREV